MDFQKFALVRNLYKILPENYMRMHRKASSLCVEAPGAAYKSQNININLYEGLTRTRALIHTELSMRNAAIV